MEIFLVLSLKLCQIESVGRPMLFQLCIGNDESDQARKGHSVDALVLRGDEGRGTLRKATGSCERAMIRGCPNGETRPFGVIAA